jgi:glycosyltransferase involved in cell wall biosynthesis
VRILYAYDEILPSTATDTEQVVNTVAALARAGVEVELRVPRIGGRPVPTPEILREYYQVAGDFAVLPFQTSFDGARPLQKAAHAARAARGPNESGGAIWYTRNLPCLAAGLAAGYRVVFEHWRPWPDQYPPLQVLLRAAMRHPRFLGAVLHSEHARESYERLGIAPDRLRTIHNGYDPDRMEPVLTREQARTTVGLPMAAKIAMYSGRVNAQKGIGALLELARRCPEVTVVIVGSEGYGPVEREAASIANVTVVPWQAFDLTVTYLYAADVLLLPLTLEALEVHKTAVLPMKLFLYLASGRPVLAPIAPDTRELLDAHNAALVPPDDPAAAAARLRQLLSDRELWERTARAARETARELTWDRRARRIVEFIEERVAAGPACGRGEDPWSVQQWLRESERWVGDALQRRRE